MGTRRKSRELALQCLYQMEITGCSWEVGLSRMGDLQTVDARALPYAKALLGGVQEHWDRIDACITRHAANWRVSRMSYVDRNILRLAAYEMMYGKVPASVVINEAVEVAKSFGADESSGFINGILDAINRAGDAAETGASA